MAYKPGEFVPEDGVYKCSCGKNEMVLKKGQVFRTCGMKNHFPNKPTEWDKKE